LKPWTSLLDSHREVQAVSPGGGMSGIGSELRLPSLSIIARLSLMSSGQALKHLFLVDLHWACADGESSLIDHVRRNGVFLVNGRVLERAAHPQPGEQPAMAEQLAARSRTFASRSLTPSPARRSRPAVQAAVEEPSR
jgi:hypothetical protein